MLLVRRRRSQLCQAQHELRAGERTHAAQHSEDPIVGCSHVLSLTRRFAACHWSSRRETCAGRTGADRAYAAETNLRLSLPPFERLPNRLRCACPGPGRLALGGCGVRDCGGGASPITVIASPDSRSI